MNPAFAFLLPYLQSDAHQSNPARCLLVADENLIDVDFSGIHHTTDVISNRFDIAQSASTASLATQFNDFDFSAYPPAHFARICYRVSKEKAVVEHIIDQAFKRLIDGGELILCGAKNEGLKRYGAVAAKRFTSSADIRKHGAMYIAKIIKPAQGIGSTPLTETSNSNSAYHELIPVNIDDEASTNKTILYTKAGVFGSAKIDQGSRMLVAYLETFIERFQTPPQSLLDLGCGYGYLTACAAKFDIARLVATDNCAAAIDTCVANMTRLNIPAEVIADDCARGISEKFDAIVCNPPFHQGFKTDAALSEKFVSSAAQHLKPSGTALFVVNQFVPLEKLACRRFRDISVIERDQSYKLIIMGSPL